MKAKKTIVIGAGIGGMATAALLAKQGHEVHVYEKNKQLGGRAGLIEKDGFRFDAGPSWYLMPGVFKTFFELLGESLDKHITLQKLKPAYKVFFEKHQPITIQGNIKEDSRAFDEIEPGAGEALKRYLEQSDEIYQLSLKHFLYNNYASPRDVLKKSAITHAPKLLHFLRKSVDGHVSEFVHDQRLKQILEYPMVFLGNSPYEAPALFSLMSALDFKEGVYYPRGGMFSIIKALEHICKKHGVQFHLDTAVQQIETKDHAATGVLFENKQRAKADVVISNADLHFTETRLLSQRDQTFPSSYWQKQQASPSALLIYLGISGKAPQLSHHNLFFVEDWKANFDAIYTHKKLPNPASIYVCVPSRTDTSVAPKNHENIFMLVPLPAGISLNKDKTADAAACYIKQFETMSGVQISDRIVTQTVFGPDDFKDKFNAWQSSMLGPSHLLRQSSIFRTPNKSKRLHNLYYVGAGTRPGVGLPMCLISAQLVAGRFMKDNTKRRG